MKQWISCLWTDAMHVTVCSKPFERSSLINRWNDSKKRTRKNKNTINTKKKNFQVNYTNQIFEEKWHLHQMYLFSFEYLSLTVIFSDRRCIALLFAGWRGSFSYKIPKDRERYTNIFFFFQNDKPSNRGRLITKWERTEITIAADNSQTVVTGLHWIEHKSDGSSPLGCCHIYIYIWIMISWMEFNS